jgi:hypothetical protein
MSGIMALVCRVQAVCLSWQASIDSLGRNIDVCRALFAELDAACQAGAADCLMVVSVSLTESVPSLGDSSFSQAARGRRNLKQFNKEFM